MIQYTNGYSDPDLNLTTGISSKQVGKRKDVTLAVSGYAITAGTAMNKGAFAGANSQIKCRFNEPVNQVRFTFGDLYAIAPDTNLTPNLTATPDAPSSAATASGGPVTYHCRVYYGTAVDIQNDTADFRPGANSGTNGGSAGNLVWDSVELTFGPNARTTVTVEPGKFATSEWVTLPTAKSIVMIKTWATWSGSTYGASQMVGNYSSGPALFYTEVSEFANADHTTSQIAFSGGATKTACLCEGVVASGQITKPRVLVIYDSRGVGTPFMELTGQTLYQLEPVGLGIVRAGNTHSHVSMAQSSEQALSLVAERWNWRGLVAGKVDYVVMWLGYNDLAAGLTVMKATLRSLRARINAQGAKMIACTIYPNTTSANANKGTFDSTRTAYNDYLRGGTGVGDTVDGYLEIADAIETDANNKAVPVRNGGFFITPDGVQTYGGYLAPAGAIYNDGIHTTDTGKQIIGYTLGTSGQLASMMPLPT